MSVSDTPVSGSVSGTHASTHTDNGSAHSVTERESGGKPQNRHTYLEHRWNYSIGSGAAVTVFAQAWKSGSNPAESFDLEYSLNNGGSWVWLMNILSTISDNMQSAALPGATSGSVMLRVKDTYRVSGDRNKSTIHVDHLYIQVANQPVDPPSGPPEDPSGFTATAVSSKAINLAWTDNSNNENGFRLERSLDGATNWVVVAELSAGTDSHGDAGLDAATQYFYRVSAFAGIESSGYDYADASTDEGTPPPPPPALSLSASGYKVKGKHHVSLQWSGAESVDVYRDGNKVATAVAESPHDDDIGSKGGATYEHQVCVSGGTASCSIVTTTTF